MDQVGLIHKLNYPDVTKISHVLYKTVLDFWHLVSGRTLGLMNALKYQTSLLSQAVLRHTCAWCPKINFILYKGLVLYPAKNEEIYGIGYIVPYQKFSCHVTLDKKTSMCGSQVGHVGHIQIVQWVKWVNRCDPLSTRSATYTWSYG